MATTASVRVALRVRPLTQKERLCNSAECISFIPGQPQVLIGKDHSFTYDHVYEPQCAQHHIYATSVLPLVEKYVDGFNATILAYGQTGSGKTYSMGTAIDGNTGSKEQQGIVPRFICDLFERIEQKRANAQYDAQVFVSFLELYNEDLVDLLNMQQQQQQQQQHRRRSGSEILIREDVQGNIYWSGVREEPCSDPDELLGFLTKGSLCRTTGSTDMNAVSSRSHAIFSVILKQQLPPEDDDGSTSKTIVSKFHFVDLAGSERLKRTNAQGERAREGIAINSGLLALGNVISALGDEARRSSHIPYRDSKLTRLLQDSLGGNSQTLMMACVSPADTNFVETLSTLKYANRARNIKNCVSINQEFAGSSVEVAQLRSQVARLKMELNLLRNSGSGGSNSSSNPAEVDALRHEVNRLRARVQTTSDELCQVSTERDTLLMEKHSGGGGGGDQAPAAPMIAHYQRTIRDLRNELEDTRERLVFVESTQRPVMDALQLMTTTSARGRTTPVSPRHASTSSSTTARRHRPRRSRKSHRHVTFRKSSKVPPPPMPVAPTDHNDINRWLHETMEPVNRLFDHDIRSEVRDSISKARLEIEKGLRVLENVKSKEQQMPKVDTSTEDADDHDDDLLIQDPLPAAVVEVPEDIQSMSPPADWENASVSDQRQPHDDVAATDMDDDDEMDLGEASRDHPHLAQIIEQVQNDIRIKENLVQQLERCEAEYDDMRRQFEQKLGQLVREMNAIRTERDQALEKQQQQRPARGSSAAVAAAMQREKQQIIELRNAYELKTKQLADMRRKFTQTSTAIQASRNQNESMLRALRVHVESLKLEKRRMVKRMKDETLRVKEQMTLHEREIQKLRRRQQRDAEQRRRLEMENRQVQLMLRKRSDEVVITNDKLQKVVQLLKKAVREGGVLDDRMLARCADLLHLGFLRRRLSTTHPGRHRRSTVPVEVRAAKKKHLLDRALYQYIHGKQALMEMQDLMTKRAELAHKRSELQSEREHLYGKPVFDEAGSKMVHFDQAMQHYMDDRLEAIGAEISYINARIQSLQNDAAHEILNDDNEQQEEVVEVDLSQQKHKPKAPKHVTFADQVMGTNGDGNDDDDDDEWLDMDALEERYSVPANADPETAHDMVLKVVRSLALDEAERVLETMVGEMTTLRMDQHQHQMRMQQLEKTVHDLQHTLVVMRDKAVETAIQSEKRIRRLEQQQQQQGSRRSSLLLLQEQNSSRRSSMSGFSSNESTAVGGGCVGGDDDDSAIDLRVEEHYQQFGTIFDQIYNEGISNCGKMVAAPSSAPHLSPTRTALPQLPHPQPSPTLRPVRPQSLVERTPVAAARRNSMSSPEQFLQQLVQAGLMTAQKQHPSPAEQQQQLASLPMQRRSSDTGSSRPSTPSSSSSSALLGRRRRAFSLQQQQPPPHLLHHQILPDSASRRRFSLRELSVATDTAAYHYQQHQPSPLQQEFVVTPTSSSSSARYTRNNVFDRLSHAHTKASVAKRTSTPLPA